MIEIPIDGLVTVLGILSFVAISMWVIYVNGELKDRGALADRNTKKISQELRDIKKRLHALEKR
jgi:uncharacterized protein (DUF2164 family)